MEGVASGESRAINPGDLDDADRCGTDGSASGEVGGVGPGEVGGVRVGGGGIVGGAVTEGVVVGGIVAPGV